MKFFNNIIQNCKEAQILGLQNQHKYIGLSNYLQLKTHIMFCKFCIRFLVQSKIIDKALNLSHHNHLHNSVHKLSLKKATEIQDIINKS